MVSSGMPQVGEVFVGTVVDVLPFGSFVEHPGGRHGLLHGRTVEPGSAVEVRVLDVDDEQQRFSLELV